jgi:hypothetical protein
MQSWVLWTSVVSSFLFLVGMPILNAILERLNGRPRQ